MSLKIDILIYQATFLHHFQWWIHKGVDLMQWKHARTHLIAGIQRAKSQPRNHILHKSGTSEEEKKERGWLNTCVDYNKTHLTGACA